MPGSPRITTEQIIATLEKYPNHPYGLRHHRLKEQLQFQRKAPCNPKMLSEALNKALEEGKIIRSQVQDEYYYRLPIVRAAPAAELKELEYENLDAAPELLAAAVNESFMSTAEMVQSLDWFAAGPANPPPPVEEEPEEEPPALSALALEIAREIDNRFTKTFAAWRHDRQELEARVRMLERELAESRQNEAAALELAQEATTRLDDILKLARGG